MSHTTHTRTEAITFVHDGIPDGGDLAIVVNVEKALKFNAEEEKKEDPDTIGIEAQEFLGENTVTLTIPYNIIRDFVLGKLRSREIAVLESLSPDELANYYVGEGYHNPPLPA